MILSEHDLRLLQMTEKEMLIEVKRICEKYKIPYFLVAGSVLGAVRHEDMIPWDDDIDIGMLRSDYNRFLQLCQFEINEDYFLQNYKTDHQVIIQFSKIRKNNTIFAEDTVKDLDIHKGIYIDIFPFDNVPDNHLLRMAQYTLLILLEGLRKSNNMSMCSHSKSLFRKSVRFSMCLVRKVIHKKFIDRIEEKVMTHYNKKAYSNICCFELFTIREAYKTIVSKNVILPTVLCKFGEDMYPIPGDYDFYLKKCYGDYMKFPSIENRVPKHKIYKFKGGDENEDIL